ncbi:prepilin-type N-terminal cleavage/methylation domain-containing protein [Geothrix sp.]|uniref:prepilin-type N-terminal cleavage/methylation domain-containing protein n=1 Tax=Geothrix sp. TaxID=1962974 RepID=UPI0025C0A0A1|nr:prepilin-type N-terminal cleavage/methylation domain-containing protein [Geothrix sp.]WIL19894.1 MAG: prepilin-type N-terminal cleavage/methylation domain-containing protein [Geothrix sp.]
MKKRSGFTLIEMLVVVAIIGIISAIVIPFLAGHRESARQKSTEAVAAAVAVECAAAAKAMSGAANAATVMAYVRALPNFQHPRCKNAYNPTITALTAAGAAVNDGEVGMVATQQNDTNGLPINVIAVSYKHLSTAVPLNLANVPVE